MEQALAPHPGVVPKKMFGGLAFMLNGNMAVGIHRDCLMVRVGPEGYEEALSRPHCRPMDITGRPMRGFVLVGPQGISTHRELAGLVELGVAFASNLPSK